MLAMTAGLAAQVQLSLAGTVDLSSTSNSANAEYIGNNPSAIAWNGTDLYAAGFNQSGGTANTGITLVSGALSGGTPSAAFGVLSTANLRGYSGLDVSAAGVAAAWDNGSSQPEGIQLFDTAGNLVWQKSARGGSGVGFDPGFAGVDAGTGWTTFGSGRRALQDNTTGADIYTTSNGMIINAPVVGTFWRDMDYDAQGNIYLRRGNDVVAHDRTGGNSLTNTRYIVDNGTNGNFVAVQNVAVAGDVVFWNDRSSTAGGQPFASAIKCNDLTGAPLTIDFGGFTAADGNGAYDFSYDEASATLAICDFNSRLVHIFDVAVLPANALCSGAQAITGGLVSGDNTGGSLDPNAPAWSCGNNVIHDVWFTYTPTATCAQTLTTCNSGGTLTDTVLEVFTGDCGNLTLVGCNDDGCGAGFLSSLDVTMVAGTTYYIRIGGWGGAEGTFDLEILNGSFAQTLAVNGGAPGSGGFSFTDGDTLTFEYFECNPGSFVFNTVNYGAGPLPVGATVEIPGFVQTSALSTPVGAIEIMPAVLMVAGASQNLTIPPGIFATGDELRFQALYLDFVSTPLPVTASNPMTGAYVAGACVAGTEEGFEGLAGTGSYPTTWSGQGVGQRDWTAISSATVSSGTGPQSANEGQTYMYCETSSPSASGDTYVLISDTYTGGSSVKFDLTRVGATIGTLDVTVDDGTGPQLIYTATGPGTAEWEIVTAALPAGIGSYQVTFTYTRGASFTGDLGIDAFCILQ